MIGMAALTDLNNTDTKGYTHELCWSVFQGGLAYSQRDG